MPVFRSRARANLYRNLIIVFTILLLVCEGILFLQIQRDYSLFQLHFVALFTPWLFIPFIIVFYVKHQIWSAGAEGEENVAEVLNSLRGFETVNDVVLPGEKANIDHVAVSTKGVFVIETKNHKGLVRYRGDSWELLKTGRRGTVYSGKIGNPSKQVKRNAVALRKFLSEKLGIVAYVHGIVCFTNPEARLEVQEPTVIVIHITNLKSFFQTLEEQEALSEQEVRRIKAEVEKYSYNRPREKHV